jgi:HD-GYP domain-containing protein (c-di-GMP phosphodiesterase class II)
MITARLGFQMPSLKKSGKLSPEEYQEIQTHAAKTRTILERISFEGIYTQIPEIAGCHHEKLDGSGYPKGLRGDEIPLGARIIAVADFFEAITAKRHYREPMQIDDAMRIIDEGR